MRTIRSILPLGAALVLLAVASADAGYRLTDRDGDETLVSKGRVKEQSGEGPGPESVFDLGTARAWMSNPERRIYWEGTIDELCTTIRETAKSMAKRMEEAMDAQLSRLPPAQRAKVEDMRRGLAEKRVAEEREAAKKPGVIKVEATGETATIAGQPTRKYRVLVDGELYQEDWLTTDPALAREFALDKASQLMSRVSACAESGDPSGGRGKGVDEGEVYRKLYPHGWPLKAVSHAGGKTETKTEITKIEKQSIAESEFQPPPGYSKAPLGDVMFSGMAAPE
jgi:uncharacterized protein DUF4412